MQAALEKGLDAATEKILARLDVFHSVSTHPLSFAMLWRVKALMVRQVNSGFNSIYESAGELRGEIDELVGSFDDFKGGGGELAKLIAKTFPILDTNLDEIQDKLRGADAESPRVAALMAELAATKDQLVQQAKAAMDASEVQAAATETQNVIAAMQECVGKTRNKQ